jgi:hypothetical protein
LKKKLLNQLIKLRLIRHDLILLRNLTQSFFAKTSDKIVYGSIATLSLAIWYKFLFTQVKLHNSQAWISALAITPLLAIGLSSFVATRLKYFAQYSPLSRDALCFSDKAIYSVSIHCLALIFNSFVIIGLLKYSEKWSAHYGAGVIFFVYATGICLYFLSRALYRKGAQFFYATMISSPSYRDRTAKSNDRLLRFATLAFIKQVPFATSLKQAFGIIFILLFLSVSSVIYASLFQNVAITAGISAGISISVLFILSRVDYQLLRFSANFGYIPTETILVHLGAGLIFSGLFCIVLSFSLNSRFIYSIGAILFCWLLSILILAVYICTMRLHSKRLGTFIFQGDFLVAGLLSSLHPVIGLLCLSVRWYRIFRAAHKQQWFLP